MKAINILFNDSVFEIRAISGKTIHSAYFVDAEKAEKELQKWSFDANIYVTLNPVKRECFSREQRELFVKNPKITTTDKDIECRRWLLVDLDTVRSSGISSTDAELEEAHVLARAIFSALKVKGWADPIVAMSGNGYHLLYRVDLPNTDKITELVKKSLKVLDMLFSTTSCKVDTSVYNAARITKLYGTLAKKGVSTIERPHRMSLLKYIPSEINIIREEQLQMLADELIEPQVTTTYAAKPGIFNIDEFIVKNGIKVSNIEDYQGGKRYVLDHCCFDPSHNGKDAAIFVAANGALGYKCFHDSCADKGWQQLRELFEPQAFRGKNTALPLPLAKKDPVEIEPKKENSRPMWLKLSDIKPIEINDSKIVKSGIDRLDEEIVGFALGEVTVWSGINGSGKSILLNQLSINAIDYGWRVAMWSGEMTDSRMLNWLVTQAAGKKYTHATKWKNWFTVQEGVAQRVSEWTSDKLFIYNNEYGDNAEKLFIEIQNKVLKNNINVVVLDNLMILDILTIEGNDIYSKQASIMKMLSKMAKKLNIHIHIVCHPRKSSGLIRKADISGTQNLTDLADNCILIHRVSRDFDKGAREFFGNVVASELAVYGNVLEVVKNRFFGSIDLLIGLYYECESRRFLNNLDEDRHYGWEAIEYNVEKPTLQDNPFAGIGQNKYGLPY